MSTQDTNLFYGNNTITSAVHKLLRQRKLMGIWERYTLDLT